MLNNKYTKFINIIRKINNTNINLKFKSRNIFKREFFFIYKK